MAVRRSVLLVPVLALLALTAGCAVTVDAAPSASASPTAACPEQDGVPLPEGCAGYDPDAAMAQNDMYRQRLALGAEAQAANERLVQPITVALEELRTADGGFTEDDVRAALAEAGATAIQTRTGAGDVLFGAAGPVGGCVYGAVEAERVTVEVGGIIMDGGCLPAQ